MNNFQKVLSSVTGPVGRIHLNNPGALNSLTESMCIRIYELLREWQDNDKIHIVAVTAEGDRAFCAGGDVRQVYNEGKDDPFAARRFFSTEYRMDLAIAEFSKPYICLIDGIVMGGGLGISVNGQYRVLGDGIMAAMPETGIGLFPDVGATAFLNSCPGRTGLYFGLTGTRLKTADALYAGFGTHYIKSNRHTELLEALQSAEYGDHPSDTVERILREFSSTPNQSGIAAKKGQIDQLFGADSVETIISDLSKDNTAFALETLEQLDRMSPTSLQITAKQITDNPDISARDALILEYRMMAHVLMNHDFYEGIRAALIDKDRTPRWSPKKLTKVMPADVDAYFASLGEHELVLNSHPK